MICKFAVRSWKTPSTLIWFFISAVEYFAFSKTVWDFQKKSTILFSTRLTTENVALQLISVICYMYNAKIWTIKIKSLNKLKTFEMWLHQILLKMSWTHDEVTWVDSNICFGISYTQFGYLKKVYNCNTFICATYGIYQARKF